MLSMKISGGRVKSGAVCSAASSSVTTKGFFAAERVTGIVSEDCSSGVSSLLRWMRLRRDERELCGDIWERCDERVVVSLGEYSRGIAGRGLPLSMVPHGSHRCVAGAGQTPLKAVTSLFQRYHSSPPRQKHILSLLLPW